MHRTNLYATLYRIYLQDIRLNTIFNYFELKQVSNFFRILFSTL